MLFIVIEKFFPLIYDTEYDNECKSAFMGKYGNTLSIDNGVPRSGMLLHLHFILFYPAKFDNFKDEKISDFKTVSVSQRKNLLD